MKLKLYTLIAFLLGANCLFAQKTTANSGNWTDESTWQGGVIPLPNEDVTIDIHHNVNVGNITHNGNITVVSDATLNMSTGTGLVFAGSNFDNQGVIQGRLKFKGAANQSLTGVGSTQSSVRIIIDNPSNVKMPAGVSAPTHDQYCSILEFISGKFIIEDNCNFTVGIECQNATSDNYVMLDGEFARISMRISASNSKFLPIGTSTAYAPIQLTTTSGSSYFCFHVKDDLDVAPLAFSVGKQWKVERHSGDAEYNVKLFWNENAPSQVVNSLSCAIAKLVFSTTLTWNVEQPYDAATVEPEDGIRSRTLESNTGSNDFTVLSLTALPLELASFKGFEKGLKNVFRWSTYSETNSAKHILQRWDIQSERWSDIGSVNGHGTTTEAHIYSIEDTNPLKEAYYRLKFEDFDRTFNYSKTIFIKRNAELEGVLAVYPNPFLNELRLEYKVPKTTSNSSLEIVDQFGKVVFQQTLNIDNEFINLDLGHFSAGLYFAKLISDNEIFTVSKIIKL